MKKTALSCALYMILAGFCLSVGANITFAQTQPSTRTTGAQITISASLGTPLLKLWGYGAPNSRVEISGDRVSDFTYTRTDGYYEFPKAYLPQPSELFYPELCLIEIDQVGRATPPTCIPPLPTDKFSYDIGPVILPPTLSLEQGSITPSSQSGATGVTIPNSEVKIVLAEDRGNPGLSRLSIVKEALAYYIPSYTIKSDSLGYFSFNMPDSKPNTWHVFAITSYAQGASSPKSNTLKMEIMSPLVSTLQSIWAFILSLLTLPTLLILEIVLILLILAVIFLSKKRRRRVSPNDIKVVEQYQD